MVSFLLILACTTPPESATPIPDGVPPGAEVGPPGGPPGGEAAGNQPGQPTVPGDGTATAQPTQKAWTTYGAEVAINEAIPVGQVLDAREPREAVSHPEGKPGGRACRSRRDQEGAGNAEPLTRAVITEDT